MAGVLLGAAVKYAATVIIRFMVERYRQYVPLGIPSKFYYIDLMTGFQPVFLLYFAGAASLWSIF